MKVLLDENMLHDLRLHLALHEAFTVRFLRWNGLKNGELLRAAEREGFDAMLTADQSVDEQQNRKTRAISIVSLSTMELPVLLRNVEKIMAALGRVESGSFEFVRCETH